MDHLAPAVAFDSAMSAAPLEGQIQTLRAVAAAHQQQLLVACVLLPFQSFHGETLLVIFAYSLFPFSVLPFHVSNFHLEHPESRPGWTRRLGPYSDHQPQHSL